MHIRKISKVKAASDAWSLVDLINAIIAVLGIDSVFGKDLAKEEETS